MARPVHAMKQLMMVGVAVGFLGLGASSHAGPLGRLFGDRAAAKDAAPTQTQVQAARDEGDIARLTGWCKASKRLDRAWKSACGAVLDDLEARGDRQLLQGICQQRGEGRAFHSRWAPPACAKSEAMASRAWTADLHSCERLPSAYERHQGGLRGKAQDALYEAIGRRAAECGRWNIIWQQLLHHGPYGGGRGVALLHTLDREGQPVAAELDRYMRSSRSAPFEFKAGDLALDHALTWLHATRRVDDCKTFVSYARRASEANRTTWLNHFARAGCSQAADLAVARLSDGRASVRAHACRVLGSIGSRRHLEKMAILARRDAARQVEEQDGYGVIVWPVRDACESAMGRIELRR